MVILNYTTKIDPAKTVAEIQAMLGAKGAKSVSAQYVEGEVAAIFFSIDIHEQPVNFRLPCNWEGVLRCFKGDRQVPRSSETKEQAQRTAWRIVKDWVEAQLAIIESGQAEMAEVFLPYAMTSNGQTCYQLMASKPQLLLGA